MPYTYILDDSIKLSPTLILTADHSTPISPRFFLQNKELLFLLLVNLYMITDTYLHDPPPFNGHLHHIIIDCPFHIFNICQLLL